MPDTKKTKTKISNPSKSGSINSIRKTKIAGDESLEPTEILELTDPVELDGAVLPDEELDPVVIEALKLKNKKPRKSPAETTDYIPELERGELDYDALGEEDY